MFKSSMSKSKSSNASYSDFTIYYYSLAVDYLEVISSSKLDSDLTESIIAESATMIAYTKLVLRPIGLCVFSVNILSSSSPSLRALSAIECSISFLSVSAFSSYEAFY